MKFTKGQWYADESEIFWLAWTEEVQMKFTKGQWYADESEIFWLYCGKEGKDSEHLFRKKGASFRQWVPNDIRNQLTPASLTPDFSNAKVGDSCFCATLGNKKIDAADASCAFVHIDLGQDTHEAFYLNGKANENDIHPTLFNSFAQFMAYWDEWKLNQKGGTDA